MLDRLSAKAFGSLQNSYVKPSKIHVSPFSAMGDNSEQNGFAKLPGAVEYISSALFEE